MTSSYQIDIIAAMTTDPAPSMSPSVPSMSPSVSSRPCDGCDDPATASITFAYDAQVERTVHPLFHTYPFATFYSCAKHIGAMMATDPDSRVWLVRLL